MEEHDGRPPPELVDTHCHLNFARYDADRPAVLARAKAAGVRRSIIPAVDIAGSREVVALCAGWGECYGAIGIHPNSSADCEGERLVSALREMEALANAHDILAIGEIGLDFYRDHADPAQQERVLRAQLQLAAQLELPVILHNRDATAILLPILEEWAAELPAPLRERAGVLHSFSGEWSDAERALAAGFYLGFSGPLTYPSAAGLRRVAARAPLERIVLETDGPFLTPAPHRGKRNEPAYVAPIAARLASIRGVSLAEIAAATTASAERLFALP